MTIQDELLHPYHIQVDAESYNVMESYKTEKGKDTSKCHGYFSKIENAILKIVHLKMNTNDGKVMPLRDYIDQMDSMYHKFYKKIKATEL